MQRHLSSKPLRLQWLWEVHENFIFLKPKLYPKRFCSTFGAQTFFSNTRGQIFPEHARTSLLGSFNDNRNSFWSFLSPMVCYSTAQRAQVFDFYESNSHSTAGDQGFGLLLLSPAVVWTWACFCAPASHCHQPTLVFVSLCGSSSRRGQDWLFLPSRVILGHKQHLLSLQFLLTEQLPLSCVMKQMYLSELMKAWNVRCIGQRA